MGCFVYRATNGTVDHTEIPDWGLVREGTPCGDKLICINQTCTSIHPHIDKGKCPSNHNNMECSGHGVSTPAAYIRRVSVVQSALDSEIPERFESSYQIVSCVD